MKNISIISLLFFISFISCKSILKKNKNAFEVIEGKGVLNFIEIGYKKDFVDKTFPASDDCKIIVGKYYKSNDDANYIDNRKIILKKVDNRRCYNQKGINIFFKNNVVSKIIFTSNVYKTKKGVRVGDNVTQVLKLYGNNYQHSYFEHLFNKKRNIGLNNLGLDVLYYDNLGVGFVMNKSGKKVLKIIIYNKK